MDAVLITNVLAATVVAGTPLLLVALGELVCERSGVLNLGQEGMMLMGAVIGFIAATSTGSLSMGILAAMLGGVLMSMLFALMAITLAANQYAAGLALTIFGIGLSSFVGSGFVGQSIDGFDKIAIPLLSDIPVIGPVLFNQDLLVYGSLLIFILVFCFLKYSRGGLILRAVGESPEAANANGLKVLPVRYMAVAFGGAMAGLAGLHPHVDREHDCRSRLDRAGPGGLRHLETRACAARRLSVRRRQHLAPGAAGARLEQLDRAAGHAALCRHHHCPGAVVVESRADPPQHTPINRPTL